MNFPTPKTMAYVCLISFFLSCSSNDSEELSQSESVTTQNALSVSTSSSFELQILSIINLYRTNKGLNALEYLDIIKTQTENHTDYMIERNQISHDNFDVRSEYLINNVNAISVAENVATGFTTAELLVDAWVNSNSHRQNIEGDYTFFHISALQNAEGKWFFTNIFIKK